ncbi:aminopeptidase N-like [Toxorhynchites rutilus septentrionalis]|uniref:aminopeptidase N-like n=1 Tax=Toxorhynchites rutilus septentrionalis TaxID=329112 RepID=UPI002479A186|nr:aminopeptidase N-like [Toxorhynchites rutilus septentrionalis]
MIRVHVWFRVCLCFVFVFLFGVVNGKSLRLPNATVPLHYDLRLQTNVHSGDRSYSGRVTITIYVRERTNQIVLHADASYDSKIVRFCESQSFATIAIDHVGLESDSQSLKIVTKRQLERSERILLTIEFSGTLRNDRTGFFIDHYYPNGDEFDDAVFYAMTEFQPCYARTAFPCYDEPGLRATFDVEVVCDVRYNVHSNGELLQEAVLDDTRKLVRFVRSPPMPSYLVAVLISDFAENVADFNGVRVGMLTKPGNQRDLAFAFDITGRALDALQEYCGQNYSLPKLYQVGIDGHMGGMENWGLILYNEQYLVLNFEKAGPAARFHACALITHEVAHQFFGNLVGFRWWTHLWLSEGFATFMEEKLSRKFLPQLGWYADMHYAMGTWKTLNRDSQPLTYPMSHYVEQSEEIEYLLQTCASLIVYQKSARIIRMMEYCLEEDIFQRGIRRFIADHQFDSVVPEDLYNSLSTAMINYPDMPDNATIAAIFDSWTNQAGHPIVYVESFSNTSEYRFSQKPYKSALCNGCRWWIPIFYSSYDLDDGLDEMPAFWLPADRTSVVEWMDGTLPLVNGRSFGFYRVNYWPGGWKRIIANWHHIAATTRAKLLDDAFSLVREQELPFTTLFPMLAKLTNESDSMPWMAAMANHNLWNLVRAMSAIDAVVGKSMRSFAKHLTTRMFEIFKTNQSDATGDQQPASEEILQLANRWACRLGMVRCGIDSKQMQTSRNCRRLVSAGYLRGLGCHLGSFRGLSEAVSHEICLNDRVTFGQFLQNVLNNYQCPQMLELLWNVVEAGVPYVSVILQSIGEQFWTVQHVVENRKIEQFLIRMSSYAIRPAEQLLVTELMERLGEGSASRRKLVVVEMSRAARIAKSVLVEFERIEKRFEQSDL